MTTMALTYVRATDTVRLRYRDRLVEVHVLNGVEQLDPFVHRTLEGFAARDQAGAAAAFVDNGCADSCGEIAGSLGLAA